MVSLESVESKLTEIKRRNPVMKKPDVNSKDYFEYMTQRVILLNAKYIFLKEVYLEMDKFTLKNGKH